MRKKLAARRGRYTFPNKATHHTIHIDIDPPNPNSEETAAASPSLSPSPTQTRSPSHTQKKMARTKTTNRYSGAEINPPSTRSTQTRASREPTPPQEQPSPPPPPTSTRPSSLRGKRDMTEEPAPPPPPPRPRGSGYRSSLHPIVESDEARPPLYKSFYDEFSEESFSKNRFTMLRNYLLWKNVVIDRPLCGSFLADLKHLKLKGLDFIDMIAFQGWTSLFNIKEPVYPELRNVYLDAERIGNILGYTDDGLTVYTSRKWNPALNLSYHDALACICTRISLSDGITPTHKSLGPVYAQLHRIITHIILPQSGSYQKVSFFDTLVLFAVIEWIVEALVASTASWGVLSMFGLVRSKPLLHSPLLRLSILLLPLVVLCFCG
ncbi:hypothetical protein PIB30_082662 [Stylosanthes scabra]|uniref:Uncharacterized protein n=1 Tax=Stylosanthes scabra TaxID=79078 RepID=A0ABU6XRX2_9FABA|nr:hypothetical protein [Stylosanthes scabra]